MNTIKLKTPPVDGEGRRLYLIGPMYDMRLARDGSIEHYEFDPVRRTFIPARKKTDVRRKSADNKRDS